VLQIPACIEDGQYLLRPEMLALHGARSTGGAQFYVGGFSPAGNTERTLTQVQMECAQINITGGTGAKKPQTYSIPGIYKVRYFARPCKISADVRKANDPGVLLDIYNTNFNTKPYVIPGSCGPHEASNS
jgi:hypothetical protein